MSGAENAGNAVRDTQLVQQLVVALVECQQAVPAAALEPDNENIHGTPAWAYVQAGRHADAVESLVEAVEAYDKPLVQNPTERVRWEIDEARVRAAAGPVAAQRGSSDTV